MRELILLPASVVFLFAAIFIYAIAGSPTPDNPGWAEALVGLLLVLAAGCGGLKNLGFSETEKNSIFIKTLHVLFFVGLILPVITGVLRGNDSGLIMRDILAFLFLCLPLFLTEVFARNEKARAFLPYVLIFAGLAFAARTLMPAFNIWIAQDELLYLSNSPVVMFAAVYLSGLLWAKTEKPSGKNILPFLFLMLAIGLLLAAMLLDVQRATVAAVVLSVGVLWLDTLIRAPRRIIIPTLLLLLIVATAMPWLNDAGEAIYRKTANVGFNMRGQEIEAVMAKLSADPLGLFLGTGWGGVFASPAVGLIEVNYTHSLLSTMFLKGGVVLFTLTFVVFLSAIYQVFLIFQWDRAKSLAVFWPLVIPVFLYASHKSLDFGLILLLIGVWSIGLPRLHKTA